MLKSIMFSVAAIGLFAGTAQAQGVTLTARVLQEKVVEEAGAKRVVLAPAGTVTPGQEVVYDLSYANAGNKVAEQVVLTNPVPATLEYVSAENALVSVDGGKSFGALAALTVADADGKQRPAAAKDVTHLRWNIAAIAPGSAGHVLFKARLK